MSTIVREQSVQTALETLVSAAVLAPSGDNTQPWHFEIDVDAGRILANIDEHRDPSPMNAGQAMARIALGAAVENLLRTADANGWKADLDLTDHRLANHRAGATIYLKDIEGGSGVIDETILNRCTNRRLYDGRQLADELIDRLKSETTELGGVQTHWITGSDRIGRLAGVIARADAILFSDAMMRNAFLDNVRFDTPPDAEVDEGLSPASLEVGTADRVAMRLLKILPNWLLKAVRVENKFAVNAQKLVESASGLCLITEPLDANADDLHAGRAVQRAWLALTCQRLAVQPMMSWLVLENAVRFGSDALRASLNPDRVAQLGNDFRKVLPEIGHSRPVFLLRFGCTEPPTGRTGRLPLTSVSTIS